MEGQERIRLYRNEDEAAAYEVCLKTGDSGRDATTLYDDPLVLGHIYVGPYLKFAPEFACVLEDEAGVCGYALGVLDTLAFYRFYEREWLPGIRGRYRAPKGDPGEWSLTEQVVDELFHPCIHIVDAVEEYPAHLHIDLMPRAQGRGLGRLMMDRLIGQIRQSGSAGVHLAMALDNDRARRFYFKLGFGELEKTKDALYLGKRLEGVESPSI